MKLIHSDNNDCKNVKIKIKKSPIITTNYDCDSIINSSNDEELSDELLEQTIEESIDNNGEIIDEESKKPRRKRKLLYEDSIVLNRIVYELNEVKKEINFLRSEVCNINKSKLPILIDIKRETLDVDEKKIKGALKVGGILGDVMLFKLYYLRDNLKPIRSINLRHYEYWCNGKWIIDHYGRDIMDILSHNLKMCYIKMNTVDNYDVDDFMRNQAHVYELSGEKYKKELLRGIIKVLNTEV